MDHGYPQLSDTKVLKEFIRTESNKLGVLAEVMNQGDRKINNDQLSKNITGKTSWRTEGIKYKNNEVYLDVVEKVNSLV